MAEGVYWNGKKWVKAEDFQRPPAPKPSSQSNTDPKRAPASDDIRVPKAD